MKKHWLMAGLAAVLALGVTSSSCIGSFALTNKLLSWNRSLDNKFINELVFFAFWILPVYEVSSLADVLVLNSIEFWSGNSPLASVDKVIETGDDVYYVQSDANGYNVTRKSDGAVTRFNYYADEQQWTVVGVSGEEYMLIDFVDDTHVRVPGFDGMMHDVELSEPGMYAFRTDVVAGGAYALAD